MLILVACACAVYPWRLVGAGRTVVVAPGRMIWYGPAVYGLGAARGVCLTPKPLPIRCAHVWDLLSML